MIPPIIPAVKAVLGGIVPWWGRWVVLAALAAALIGYGFVKGLRFDEARDRRAQQQLDALARDAGERAAKQKAAQDQTTKEIRDAYESDVVFIEAYYAAHPVVVREPADSCPVCAAPVSAPQPHATACEPGVARPDPGLEGRCALDAARVNRWIEFARKNALPIEGD